MKRKRITVEVVGVRTQVVSEEELIGRIKSGSKVTILVPNGIGRDGREYKRATGTAVMPSADGGWVLNMGGQHGTPRVCNLQNFVRIVKV